MKMEMNDWGGRAFVYAGGGTPAMVFRVRLCVLMVEEMNNKPPRNKYVRQHLNTSNLLIRPDSNYTYKNP